MKPDNSRFFEELPAHTAFGGLLAKTAFRTLPEDWVVGSTDIVGSTTHVADGKYKAVNMAGAAVISALMNETDIAFPYVFGGDGASFAVPLTEAETAKTALASVRRWALEEFGFEMRCALVPVPAIRKAGHDISVARFAPSTGITYAMFNGGGMTWLDREMRAGKFDVPIAPRGTFPNLDGLSCRWLPARSEMGVILSLIVRPRPQAKQRALNKALTDLINVTGDLQHAGHPFGDNGPRIGWRVRGFDHEARATHANKPLFVRKIELFFATSFALFLFKTGIRAGQFDPRHYVEMVGKNADFRKFSDGLMMTIDCDSTTVSRLRQILDEGKSNGLFDYGIHEQDEAIMTCIVPSVTSDDHVHFVDGAAGGYTLAATALKT